MSTASGKGAGYQATLLGGFTLAAAALLVLGNLATRGAIEQRRAEDLLGSLAQVIPAGSYDNDLLADPLVVSREADKPVTVYRALRGGQVTAVAFRVTGQGYGGAVELIMGVSAAGKVLGTRVVSHAETPGLGDKIEIERDDWILGFDGRSLGDPPAARWAVKKDGGDFDQFTGATITPRAVVGAVKRGLKLFDRRRDILLAAPAPIEPSPGPNGETP
jgi:electron transport complex protein RnfG